jgi:hypothetical protein
VSLTGLTVDSLSVVRIWTFEGLRRFKNAKAIKREIFYGGWAAKSFHFLIVSHTRDNMATALLFRTVSSLDQERSKM